MAENKMGQNLQAGAEFFTKRLQKSLSRAQEKVLQKLGKSMETKDEQFELCFQNLNKQQTDGSRLFKDVRAYHAAVKAVHETSRRLSQTLRDTYETDWSGVEDLAVITESEDLLWNDFEEKVNDQIIRTMENYTSQFPEVKERVAKRGRKLVDYDSARHHLETLQSAKKKDEAKVAKAEEEFNKAQSVFEEINNELREELPVLYQSRIGCYVTVFQNISNLRDVFYKEMSVLNRELYNVMKKLETQHSGKAFIIKGLNSTSGKTKKKKSLVISNPIPCNTAFPADHVSILSSAQNGKEAVPTSPVQRSESTSEETSQPEEGSTSSKDVNSSESDLSSSGTGTPQRQSLCDNESDSDAERNSEKAEEEKVEKEEQEEEEEEKEEEEKEEEEEDEGIAELTETKSDDSVVEVSKPEDVVQEESTETPPTPEQEKTNEPTSSKPPPVPAPRVSFRCTERPTTIKADQQGETKEASADQEEDGKEDDSTSHDPPGFMYKGVATESHEASAEGLLQFEEGDVILVLGHTSEDGTVKGVREETWNQHKDLENHCGIFSEKLIWRIEGK